MSDRGLLDTSVFIAAESGRPLNEDLLPEEAAVSVVTLAELAAGVLAARDIDMNDVDVLLVDIDVARVWAQFGVSLAEAGRRINVTTSGSRRAQHVCHRKEWGSSPTQRYGGLLDLCHERSFVAGERETLSCVRPDRRTPRVR